MSGELRRFLAASGARPVSPDDPMWSDNYVTEAAVSEGSSETGRYYPEMPPALDGETDAQYTDRLTGADRTDRRPYDHRRNRQCSIGYHDECSDPQGETCQCPCHTTASPAARHDDPRPFALIRDEDVTGVSGTGVVARGVEFGDGTCVMRWETGRSCTVIYDDRSDLLSVHGHDGKTRLVWIEAR